MIRRRTRQPRKLKQPSHTVLDTLAALVPRAPEAPSPNASLVAILVVGRAGHTWDSDVPAFRDWQQFAATNGFTALQAKPAEFLHFFATRAEGGVGSAKMHICAIDAVCQLVAVSSPSGDATFGAFRRGVRRAKHATRGPVRPMFLGEIPEMSQEPPSGARRWKGLAPGALACRIGTSAGSGGPSCQAALGRQSTLR